MQRGGEGGASQAEAARDKSDRGGGNTFCKPLSPPPLPQRKRGEGPARVSTFTRDSGNREGENGEGGGIPADTISPATPPPTSARPGRRGSSPSSRSSPPRKPAQKESLEKTGDELKMVSMKKRVGTRSITSTATRSRGPSSSGGG